MSRAIKRVYDEPNPFAPDFKRGREKPKPAVVNRMKTRMQGIYVYTRHKQLINAYLLYHPGASKTFQRDASSDKNDYDIIRENHKFVWGDDEVTEVEQSWEARLAKKYYDKLFKEYCIAELSQFEKNRIAMRWRTEKEVRSGKGQFECGSKHCNERDDLSTWEVNFAYIEHAERKNALVKLRLCPECSLKLNYHSRKRQIKKEHEKRKKHKRNPKKQRPRGEEEDGSDHEQDLPGTSAAVVKKELEEGEEEEGKKEDETEKKKESEKQEKLAAEIWTKEAPTAADEQRQEEEEFDEFLDDLLL